MAVLVYFIAGAVVMKVRYQATGSELIPNKTFWMALPILVKVSREITLKVLLSLVDYVYYPAC